MSALLLGVIPGQSADTVDPSANLPAEWHADFGAPVAWQGETLWFYADLFDCMGPDMMPCPDATIARNGLVVDGELLLNVLPSTDDGINYWITDATELADGSLLVIALEERDRFDRAGWFNFDLLDTTAFIVNDPTSDWSWRYAHEHGRIDDGPWGDDIVYFSDQVPGLAFVKDPYFDNQTDAVAFDPGDPTAPWQTMHTVNLPARGAFAPVQTADGWIGVAWGNEPEPALWHEVETWRADTLEGEWTLVATEHTELATHDHQLNVVDGVVWHRSNNLDGSRRPEYERVAP